MLCAMYLRKSRADQEAEARGEGETLARHETTLRAYAAGKGLHVKTVYREIVSGDTIADRPEMRRLLSDVERGEFDAVLCMDIDRLGRGDGADQATILKTLKYSDTIVITPLQTYDARKEMDEEFLEYAQFMSRGEFKRIKRRMWAGRVASAKEGKWQSPKAPFGYRRVRLDAGKGWTLEPDPAEAEAVRNMYHWYADEGVGGRVISNRLNAAGHKTPDGNAFADYTVMSILRNPVYRGRLRWNYRRQRIDIRDGVEVRTRPKSEECIEVDGLHPAIVDEDLWYAVQRRLANNGNPRLKAAAAIRNPLAGLMYCAECGKAMLYVPEYSRKIVASYRCRTYDCPTVSVDVDCVYASLLDGLHKWVNMALAPVPQDTNTSNNDDSAAIAQRLEGMHAQMERLRDLVETGVYTVEVYLQRSNALQQKIDAAQAELDRFHAADASTDLDAIRANLPRIQQAIQMWPTASPAERNATLRQIIRRVVYHKTIRAYRGSNPAEHLTLDLFPLLK